MASSYTANYGLCQWQAEDQVLRTEFNQDNAKVEAALTALAAADSCRLLAAKTLTAAASKLDLSLSGVDLSLYRRLDLHISGSQSATAGVSLGLNGLTGVYFYKYGTSVNKENTYLLSFTMTANPSGAAISLHLLGEQLVARWQSAAWDSNTIYFGGTDEISGIKSSVLSVSKLHTLNIVAYSIVLLNILLEQNIKIRLLSQWE